MIARPRVLVCGTNYGSSYLAALASASARYRLAGILARGSTRSTAVASRLGVPLYRALEDVPRDVELACAALGASGAGVVLGLLERGIHVLCEHPQPPELIERSLETAGRCNACFHVNGHFAYLPAARAFARGCRQLACEMPPLFVDMFVSDRSLYSALDILRRTLPAIVPFTFADTFGRGAFSVVQGRLGGVPASVGMQREGMRPVGGQPLEDGSGGYLVDHRLTVAFERGSLTLLSISGPVVWTTPLRHGLVMEDRMWRSISGRAPTAAELLRQRIVVNRRAIDALATHARGGLRPADQSREHLLEVSGVWATLAGPAC